MKLLTLKRKQMLYAYLEDFNKRASNSTAPDYILTEKHLKNWRILLLVLPQALFINVIRFAVLLLLNYDPSLSISGKKLSFLAKQFTKYELQLARKLTSTISKQQCLDFTVLALNNVSADELHDKSNNRFMNYGITCIVQALYANLDSYIQQRATLQCNANNMLVPQEFTEFWGNFTAAQIEQAVLAAAQTICNATFKLDLAS